jgi:hypothetical protein
VAKNKREDIGGAAVRSEPMGGVAPKTLAVLRETCEYPGGWVASRGQERRCRGVDIGAREQRPVLPRLTMEHGTGMTLTSPLWPPAPTEPPPLDSPPAAPHLSPPPARRLAPSTCPLATPPPPPGEQQWSRQCALPAGGMCPRSAISPTLHGCCGPVPHRCHRVSPRSAAIAVSPRRVQ